MSVTVDTHETATAPDKPLLQPVDRTRRFLFVSCIVGFCLLGAAVFTAIAAFGGFYATAFGSLIELFVSGMISLATATTIAYITGSVVDYNGGVANMFTKTNRPKDTDAYILPEAKG